MHLDTRFRPATMDAARAVILTPEGGQSVAERWKQETPWLLDEVHHRLPKHPHHPMVLDYGCGVGRLSSESHPDIAWINVDASQEMLDLGQDTPSCGAPRVWMRPSALEDATPGIATACTCFWVLQHIHRPREAIDLITRAVEPGGLIFVLNSDRRWLPTWGTSGWDDDGLDIWATLATVWDLVEDIPLEHAPILAEGRKFRVYRRRHALPSFAEFFR